MIYFLVLNKNYVLTAAHCVNDTYYWSIEIYFGILNRLELYNAIKRTASKAIVHEKYNNPPYNNDIALIKLNHPLEFSETIQPVKLSQIQDKFNGRIVTVSGWGATEIGFSSDKLLWTDLRVMDDEKCKEVSGRNKNWIGKVKITEGIICVTYDIEPRSACQRDSGGPLVLKGTAILVGIVSAGFGCGDDLGLYTRVSHYKEWIEEKTGV